MSEQKLLPAAVSELRLLSRGVDEVREEHCGQDGRGSLLPLDTGQPANDLDHGLALEA